MFYHYISIRKLALKEALLARQVRLENMRMMERGEEGGYLEICVITK
jgi:hypothetical protein